MKTAILFVSLIAVSRANAIIDPFIIGGSSVSILDYPHQVSIAKGTDFLNCGGSIISDLAVLTAARCVDFSTTFSVRVGSDHYDSGGQLIEVEKVIIHDNYDPISLDYNFAILILKDQITDPNAHPIELAGRDDEEPFEGDRLTISGWGLTSTGGWLASDLQAATVIVEDTGACKNTYGSLPYTPNYISPQMFCAGNPGVGGVDACTGDDGGGAVNERGVLYGVISFRYDCASPTYSGVYGKVLSVREWIHVIAGI